MQLPRHAPLVVTTRGEIPECVHYGSIAVVDRAGKLVAGLGDPQALNFARSALKPFQALPLVEDGGIPRFGFGSHELALMQAGKGDWVAKAGAAGVQALGIESKGYGIAIRIADGTPAALRVATHSVLAQLGLLKDAGAAAIRNDRGIEVGRIEACFRLGGA